MKEWILSSFSIFGTVAISSGCQEEVIQKFERAMTFVISLSLTQLTVLQEKLVKKWLHSHTWTSMLWNLSS